MSLAHATPLSSQGRNPGAAAVHVLASALYAAVAWLALLAWLVISDGPVLVFLLLSPLIISSAIILCFSVSAVLFLCKLLISKALRRLGFRGTSLECHVRKDTCRNDTSEGAIAPSAFASTRQNGKNRIQTR